MESVTPKPTRIHGSLRYDIDDEARQELCKAYEKIQELEKHGVEFGRLCCKWYDWYMQKEKDKGDRIRYMWKSLGITPSVAYRWMDAYKESIGWKPKIDIQHYSDEELARSRERAANECRLVELFKDWDFPMFVKQNGATNEPHFNVVFSALTETQVKQLAQHAVA